MCDPKLSDSTDSLLARIATLEDKLALLSKGALPIEQSEPSTITEQPYKEETVNEPTTTKEEITPRAANQGKQYLEIDAWDEVIAKIRERNSMIASFIVKVIPPLEEFCNIFSLNSTFKYFPFFAFGYICSMNKELFYGIFEKEGFVLGVIVAFCILFYINNFYVYPHLTEGLFLVSITVSKLAEFKSNLLDSVTSPLIEASPS